MKQNIYNGTDKEITVVTESNGTHYVNIPFGDLAVVDVAEGAIFNHKDGDFYVENEGNFYASYENTSVGADINIYEEL